MSELVEPNWKAPGSFAKKNRRRLRAQSEKRVAEKPTRESVCVAVYAAHGGRCALGAAGSCRNERGAVWRHGDALDFHEVIRRSQMPGAHLDQRVVIPLCRSHHELDSDLIVAEALGIRAPRWAVDQYGLERVLAELARIRSVGHDAPFWR